MIALDLDQRCRLRAALGISGAPKRQYSKAPSDIGRAMRWTMALPPQIVRIRTLETSPAPMADRCEWSLSVIRRECPTGNQGNGKAAPL
jgi:hypothetical protein